MIIPNLAQEVVVKSLSDTLSAFENERNRHREYLLDFYEGYSQQYVEKYFGTESLRQVPMFSQNLTRRVCALRGLSYKRPPRAYVDDRYEDFVHIAGLNSTRRQLERLTFLLGTMAYRCRWSERKQRVEHEVLPFFEPLFLEGGDPDPFGVMFPIQYHGNQRMNELTYSVWTEDRPGYKGQHYLINANGDVQSVNEQDINPYGVMPVVFTHRENPSRDWFTSDASDVVTADLSLSVGMTELALCVRLGAIGQRFITNIDTESRVELGVDKILFLPQDSQAGIMSPTADLNAIIQSLRFMTEATLQNNHIRVKFLDAKGNSPSAASLKLQDIELTDERAASLEDTWRPFELERFEVDRKIIEVQTGVKLDPDYSVDFVEPDHQIMTVQDEVQYWQWRFDNNLATKEDFFKATNVDYNQAQLEEFKQIQNDADEATPPVNRLLNRLQS